jgi:hypothetical protein
MYSLCSEMKSLFVIGVLFAVGGKSSLSVESGKALMEEIRARHAESVLLIREISEFAGLGIQVSARPSGFSRFAHMFDSFAGIYDVFDNLAPSRVALDAAAKFCSSVATYFDAVAMSPRIGGFKHRVDTIRAQWTDLRQRAAAPPAGQVARQLSEEASVKVEELLHDAYAERFRSEEFVNQIRDTLKAHGAGHPVLIASRVFSTFEAAFDSFRDEAGALARRSVFELMELLPGVGRGCTCSMEALSQVMGSLEGNELQLNLVREMIQKWKKLRVRTNVIVAEIKRDFGVEVASVEVQCIESGAQRVELSDRTDGGLMPTGAGSLVQASAPKKKKSYKKRNGKKKRDGAKPNQGREDEPDDLQESRFLNEPIPAPVEGVAGARMGANEDTNSQRTSTGSNVDMLPSIDEPESSEVDIPVPEGSLSAPVETFEECIPHKEESEQESTELNALVEEAEKPYLAINDALPHEHDAVMKVEDVDPVPSKDNLMHSSSESSNNLTPLSEDSVTSPPRDTLVNRRDQPVGKWRRPRRNPRFAPPSGVLMPAAMVPFTQQLLGLSQQMGILADQMHHVIQTGYWTAPFPGALGMINHYATQFEATYRSIQYLQSSTGALSQYANSLPPVVVPPPTQSWIPYNL